MQKPSFHSSDTVNFRIIRLLDIKGLLKTLVTRAFKICSTDAYLKEELEHTQTVFHHRNNYPLRVTDKVTADGKKVPSANENNPSSNDRTHR